MGEGLKIVLANLVKVSKEDAALSRIAAEKAKLENDLKIRQQEIDNLAKQSAAANQTLQDQKSRCTKEEKLIAEEEQKLIGRRKALQSLNNYKLQQAAEREIEHAARDLSSRENALLQMMEQLQTTEAGFKVLEEKLNSLRSELAKVESEVKDTLSNLEQRFAVHSKERDEIAKNIDAASLQNYDRVRQKFPMDPIVAVTNGPCPGCFMQVVPQIMVQIGRGDGIIKCRGCGRILYIQEDQPQ